MKKINHYITWICLWTLPIFLSAQSIDLSGKWGIALDSTDIGEQEKWYEKHFSQSIQLPGTTDDAGIGIPNSYTPKLEKPQLLRLTRKHSYIGAAWYTREINIPETMAGKTLVLRLERVMWKSELWIDGIKHHTIEESLTTPHCFLMPEGLTAGRHTFTLRIDNRKQHDISVNDLAHAYTNDTQIMWNGVLGKMTLEALPEITVKQVDVYPDVKQRNIRILTILENTGKTPQKAKVTFRIKNNASGEIKEIPTVNILVPEGKKQVETTYTLGKNTKLWDEFSPVTYSLNVSCQVYRKEDAHKKGITFGMREIDTHNGFLTVNTRRIFLRGTLECCIFPLTGTPPMNEEGWQKVFRTAKEWGLNHLRFHSWCPPEAAFRVADKMGFYLQVELPNWSLNVGKDEATSRFLYNEFDRIIKEYGNHPSFCLLTVGNELQPDFGFLNNMVAYMKSKDSRHLYATTSFTFEKGHGMHPEPEDEFFITQWTDNGWVRGQGVFDQESPNFNKDYRTAAQGIGVPLISHEIGQYAIYPNLKEIDKYTGILEPLNFKAVRNDLIRKGLYNKAEQYLMASGKLAVQLYKEEIERAMKTPQFSGFQLLDLHDFPGQGTALVGLLDAFWDSKGFITAEDFRHFCSPVVPLARFGKAVYKTNERFSASIEIANYSSSSIKRKKVVWHLKDAKGNTITQGILPETNIAEGGVTLIDTLQADLNGVKEASKLTFEVALENTNWKNSWSIWVYPDIKQMNVGEVVMTQELNVALKALNEGKKVLFSPSYKRTDGLEGKFVPVFWSPVHFPKQAGTMGLLCDPYHPALQHFPTDMHSDWQWWTLVKNSRVAILDSFPQVTPIIESVDNFTNNRRLASVFEAQCSKGSLIVSTMDLLSENTKDKPEVKQLLFSLLQYMNSTSFRPTGKIEEEALHTLLLQDGIKQDESNATSIYN